MKKIIKNVLGDLAGSQLNFESESARETIASLLASTLKSKGCYTKYDDSETTDEYNPDTEGMTGHDHGMVWEHDMGGSYLTPRLSSDIMGGWIYESPDGGKTVFRRRSGEEYDAKNKEEIYWKTKLPTGRVFSDYNNGSWNQKDEG
jgi:hypothetical protein